MLLHTKNMMTVSTSWGLGTGDRKGPWKRQGSRRGRWSRSARAALRPAHTCWRPAGGAELALLSAHSERESSRAWASALAFLCRDPCPASDQSAGPRRGWASPPPGPLRTQEVRPPPETMTKAGLRGRLVLRPSGLSHPPRLGAAQLTAPAEAARSRLPSSPPRPGTGAGALCGHLLRCG